MLLLLVGVVVIVLAAVGVTVVDTYTAFIKYFSFQTNQANLYLIGALYRSLVVIALAYLLNATEVTVFVKQQNLHS